jgi:hypothetical protein
MFLLNTQTPLHARTGSAQTREKGRENNLNEAPAKAAIGSIKLHRCESCSNRHTNTSTFSKHDHLNPHEHNKISSPVTELGKPDPLPDPRRSQNCDAGVESVGAELRKVKESIVAHICS